MDVVEADLAKADDGNSVLWAQVLAVSSLSVPSLRRFGFGGLNIGNTSIQGML